MLACIIGLAVAELASSPPRRHFANTPHVLNGPHSNRDHSPIGCLLYWSGHSPLSGSLYVVCVCRQRFEQNSKSGQVWTLFEGIDGHPVRRDIGICVLHNHYL